MSKAPVLTPVEVNLLTGADETARDLKAAVLNAAGRAVQAMRHDMLPLARNNLTHALAELDTLEARLTEIRGQR